MSLAAPVECSERSTTKGRERIRMQLVEKITATTVLMDSYLTLPAAARYTSLSVRVLRAAIARDQADAVPHFRVGRRVLIRKSDLDMWLSNCRISGRPGVVTALKEIGLHI
jgi:excisionase family DNA binding protein